MDSSRQKTLPTVKKRGRGRDKMRDERAREGGEVPKRGMSEGGREVKWMKETDAR